MARQNDDYWTPARTAVVVLLGLLVAAAVGYGGTHLTAKRSGPVLHPAAAAARPGDCVTDGGTRPVDCASAAARFQVVGTFPGSTDGTRCADVPGTEFALIQHVTGPAGTDLLCVEPLRIVPRWQGE